MLSPFSFDLPDTQIARYPTALRDACRLLVVERASQSIKHRRFADITEYIRKEDLLLLNNSRVLKARLRCEIAGKEGEIFLLDDQPLASGRFACLVRPGKKIKPGGTEVRFRDGSIFQVFRFEDKFELDASSIALHEWLERNGEIPLPPYLKREAELEDEITYQTVFSAELGSVAAPTAGLHFSEDLLQRLARAGTSIDYVTLHVGYGTFAPLTEEDLARSELHSERYRVSPDLIGRVDSTRKAGGRVVAVGTTTVRTLESLDGIRCQGTTNLLIQPGFRFQRTDALITNFHLPDSSLLHLVAAFGGVELVERAYRCAIEEGYRFYSYGDAMLII